jgi:hypothetical protein
MKSRLQDKLIDAAIVALDRLEERQFLSLGGDGHTDAIKGLRRALKANGVDTSEVLAAKRRFEISQGVRSAAARRVA